MFLGFKTWEFLDERCIMKSNEYINAARFSLARLPRTLQGRGFRYIGYLIVGFILPAMLFGVYARLPQNMARTIVRKLRSIVKFLLPLLIGLSALSVVTSQLDWLWLATWGISVFIAAVLLFFILRNVRFILMLGNAEELMKAREQQGEIFSPRTWKEYPIGETVRSAVNAARDGQREFLLASIDISGRAYCEYGQLPYLPSVSAEDFAERDRYDIDIVLYDEYVLLRKDFRGDKSACLREWFHMEPMYGKANVPTVRVGDIHNAVLYMDYIYGRTVLEILRDKGALIRDSDIENDPSFVGLDEETRQRKLDERGTRLLQSCFSDPFFKDLDALLDAVHRCRLTDLDIRFANILVDDAGKPWLIDFHEATFLPRWAEWIFRLKCDGDAQNYNRIFGRTKLTEATARLELSRVEPNAWHSAVDLGYGLARGNFFFSDAGMGRWESFTAEGFPDLKGKRIFVLNGCNGVVPLLMLRAGAREVIAVEKNIVCYDAAAVAHRILEWRDMQSYNLKLHYGDARALKAEHIDLLAAVVTPDHFHLNEFQHVLGFATEQTSMVVVDVNEGEATRRNRILKAAMMENIMSRMSENRFSNLRVVATSAHSSLIVGEREMPVTETKTLAA